MLDLGNETQVGDWISKVGDPFGPICEIAAIRPDGYDKVPSEADPNAASREPYTSNAKSDPCFDDGWMSITPRERLEG